MKTSDLIFKVPVYKYFHQMHYASTLFTLYLALYHFHTQFTGKLLYLHSLFLFVVSFMFHRPLSKYVIPKPPF